MPQSSALDVVTALPDDAYRALMKSSIGGGEVVTPDLWALACKLWIQLESLRSRISNTAMAEANLADLPCWEVLCRCSYKVEEVEQALGNELWVEKTLERESSNGSPE